MPDIDMQEVCDILRSRGDESAYVEQTGGGCATIYAGGHVGTYNGDPIWGAVAGPGWFEGPSWSRPVASTDEFYVGRDGSGYDVEWSDDYREGTSTSPAPGASAATIADLIEATARESRGKFANRDVTLTLTPGALAYLSTLTDSDDSPDVAIANGHTRTDWSDARGAVRQAIHALTNH